MQWVNVVVYLGLLVLTAGALLAAIRLFGPRQPRPEKLSPYECGMQVVTSSRERFSVKFYLVAILFIMFDVETVFLIPWAVKYQALGIVGLVEMVVFLGVLIFGLIYVWKRGALEWD